MPKAIKAPRKDEKRHAKGKRIRARGEGTIWYDEKRHCYKGLLPGSASPDGKRKSATGNSPSEVASNLQRLRQILAQPINEQQIVLLEPMDETTLGGWLPTWVNVYKTGIETKDDYLEILQRHVISKQWGRLKVRDVRGCHVQSILNELTSKDHIRTAEYLYTLLNAAFKRAVIDKIIAENPCTGIDKPHSITKKPDYWTTEEVDIFVDEFSEHRLFPIYYLMLATGCRKEEVLGLKWDDINFKTGIITLRRVVVEKREKGKCLKDATKNGHDFDTVGIGPETLKYFSDYHKRQTEGMLKIGRRNHENWVFATPNMSFYSPSYITRELKSMLENSSIKCISPHKLRHTHATLLYQGGVPIEEISLRLRHSSTSITRTYVHESDETKRSVGEKAESIVFAGTKKKAPEKSRAKN